MKYSNWAMGLANQLVAWFTRPRNRGLSLIFASSSVLIAIASSNVSLEAQGIAGVVNLLKFSTGEGLPGHLQSALVYLMIISFIIGLILLVLSFWRDWREADAKRLIVVELRGLVDTSDHPLLQAVPRRMSGRKVDCLVDVRHCVAGNTPNIQEALEEVGHIRRDVRRVRGDSARENVQVIAGGVMQVPLLFYAGTRLDDEGRVVLMDWERTARQWQQLVEPDDKTRFAISGVSNVGNSPEVVVAVSATYRVALDDIESTFPDLPVVHLERPDPTPNALWSEETQAALTQQFLQTLADLANRGVRTVHLVLAASSSLSLRFGMAYDPRNMPTLRCYQREREHIPPYPWSVQMPNDARSAAVYLPTPIQTVATGQAMKLETFSTVAPTSEAEQMLNELAAR